MHLAEALAVLAAPILGPRADEALRTVGGHLAAHLDPPPGAVAVAVGRQGVDLQRGAGEALTRAGHKAMPIHVAQPHTDSWSDKTSFTWVNAPPPPGLPIVVFIPHLVTGHTIGALLAKHPRTDPETPVTVIAIDAEAAALAELLDQHPDLQVVTTADTPLTGAQP